MSLKNCLSFELARNTYKSFPDGIPSTLNSKILKLTRTVLGCRKLSLCSSFEADFTDPYDLSNTLFINIDFFPASLFPQFFGNHHTRNSIENWVSLGVEVAGMNLSDSDLESVLVCGSTRSQLQAMGVCINNSRLTNVVLAYSNLKGLSSINTEFADALIRNCSIVFARFKDYRIQSKSEFGICYDENDSVSKEVSRCVFECEHSQCSVSTDYTFSITEARFKDCSFLGFFEPTHLNNVEFFKCRFGNNDCQCIIQNKSSSKQTNHWNITSSSLDNCILKGLNDAFHFDNCSCAKLQFAFCDEIGPIRFDFNKISSVHDIAIKTCGISSFVINAYACEHPPLLTFSGSRIADMEVKTQSAKCKSDYGLHIRFADSMSTIMNPKLIGVQFEGDLSKVSFTGDSSSSLLECCTFNNDFSCNSITKSFLDFSDSSPLYLRNVEFTGESAESPLIFDGVDFSKNFWEGVRFKYCTFKNCTFPSSSYDRKTKTGVFTDAIPLMPTRATFIHCRIESNSIEKADFSRCEFFAHCFVRFDVSSKVKSIIQLIECDFSFSVFSESYFENVLFKSCLFSECVFEVPADSRYLLSHCDIIDCFDLVIRGNIAYSSFTREDSPANSKNNSISLTLDSNNKLPCMEHVTFNGIELIVCSSDNTADSDEPGSFLATNSKFNNTIRASNQNIASKIGCFFEKCTFTKATLDSFAFTEGSFKANCILDHVFLANSEFEYDAFVKSILCSVEFRNATVRKSLSFKNCLLEQSTQEISCLKFSSLTSHDKDRVGIYFHSCYCNFFNFFDISKPSVKITIGGGSNSPKLPPFDEKMNTDKVSFANKEMFDKDLPVHKWRREQKVYRHEPRKLLHDLWKYGEPLEHLGHSLLEIPSREILNDQKKIEFYCNPLTPLLESRDLEELLSDCSFDKFKDIVKKTIQKLRSKGSVKDHEALRESLATATRLRLRENPLAPQDIRKWLKNQEIDFLPEALINKARDKRNDKYYGDFLLLEKWIFEELKKNVAKYHDGRVCSAIDLYDEYLILHLGSYTKSQYHLKGDMKTFLTMTHESIRSELNEEINPFKELQEYADSWIYDSDKAKLSIVTDTVKGRFSFVYSGSNKWNFKEWNPNNCPWDEGICFSIPIYSFKESDDV